MDKGRNNPAGRRRSAAWALVAGATVLVALTASPAGARAPQRSDTATMHVSMSVAAACTVSATPVDFGNYNPIVQHATQPLDTEATVTATCTPNTRLTLEMDLGRNASGGTRRLSAGTGFLRYELFQDAGRTRIWGSGSQALRLTTPPTSTAPTIRTVYARIEPGQNIAAGDYDDVIEVIMHF